MPQQIVIEVRLLCLKIERVADKASGVVCILYVVLIDRSGEDIPYVATVLWLDYNIPALLMVNRQTSLTYSFSFYSFYLFAAETALLCAVIRDTLPVRSCQQE